MEVLTLQSEMKDLSRKRIIMSRKILIISSFLVLTVAFMAGCNKENDD